MSYRLGVGVGVGVGGWGGSFFFGSIQGHPAPILST